MQGETKERWRELCEQAIFEQDPDRFIATIQELIQVLDDNEERRRKATGLPVPPIEKASPVELSGSLSTQVCDVGLFRRRGLLVLFPVPRRNVGSGAPFHEEWIRAKALAQAFDVLVQCLPQFDEYRP
ncbi:MAG: hypothetical protein WB683_04295 [Candidatus Sulfotelmatobacter sp.]